MKPTHNRMKEYCSPQAQPLTIYCQVCGLRLSDREFMADHHLCFDCIAKEAERIMVQEMLAETHRPLCAGGQGRDAGEVEQSNGSIVMVFVGAFGALFSGLAFIGACAVVRWMMN